MSAGKKTYIGAGDVKARSEAGLLLAVKLAAVEEAGERQLFRFEGCGG